MTQPPVDMVDAIHANVPKIPLSTPKVLGYISGSPEIEWTPEDWARFPHSGHDLMEQGFPLTAGQILAATSFDVERGALTPGQIPAIVHARITHGIRWTCVYAGDANLALVEQALAAAENVYGHRWYYGHVKAHLADWSLSRAEAEALLGREIHGLGCVAVQWDHQPEMDTSVTVADWCPAAAPPPPASHLLALAKSAVGATLTASADLHAALADLDQIIAGLQP